MGRVILIIGCLVALAAGLGACGGSDDPKGESPAKPKRESAAKAKAESAARPKSAGAKRTPTDDIRTNALGRREFPAVRRMLRRLVAGVNSRDPSICTRLYTRHYRERLMGRKGAAAVAACRKEVSGVDFRASLVRIERVELRYSKQGVLGGPVRVVQRLGKRGLLHVSYIVVRTADGYRIDRGQGQLTPPGS